MAQGHHDSTECTLTFNSTQQLRMRTRLRHSLLPPQVRPSQQDHQDRSNPEEKGGGRQVKCIVLFGVSGWSLENCVSFFNTYIYSWKSRQAWFPRHAWNSRFSFRALNRNECHDIAEAATSFNWISRVGKTIRCHASFGIWVCKYWIKMFLLFLSNQICDDSSRHLDWTTCSQVNQHK